MKSKVLIIFPHPPSRAHSTHYPYWHSLFKASEKKLQLAYLYESSQVITAKPFNLLERMLRIINFRLKGYTNVYIHYSYAAVILSKVIALFIPMKIYYWNCEKYTKKPGGMLAWILPLCNVLVTGSKSLGEQYQKIFNIPHTAISIVPNWVKSVGANQHLPKLSKKQTHILFVHHLSARKGSRELPAIIKETVKHLPNAHFHIIGNGPDFAWLSSQLSALSSHATLYGSLPLKTVAGFFRACSYFIMPSRSEGFPRVILEAMAAKIPFVATNVGNVPEIVSPAQGRFLVPPKQPKKFAQSLIELVRSKKTTEIVIANYRDAKNYTLEIATQRFTELFKTKTQNH